MTRLVLALPTDAAAAAAIEVLREGGTVVLPTDTIYGLAASPSIAGATDAVFRLKGRAADVPLAVLCASAAQALGLASDVPDDARTLAERYWPGPLTLVLRRRADLAWNLGEPTATIGVRCPDAALIRRITEEIGPIATTSANRHGEPTPPTALEAANSLTEPPDLIIDGGPSETDAASTVIDASGPALEVVRPGPIEIAGTEPDGR